MFLQGGSRWAYSDELKGAEVYVRFDDRGRIVELYLTKNGAEITPADLRLPLTQLRAQGRGRPDIWHLMSQDPDRQGVDVRSAVRRAFPDEWIKGKPEQHPPFELNPSSPEGGLTDAFLQDVATAYRDAVIRGLRPNIALAQQTGHGRRTVEKWVYLARKKGFLEPTRPGSVG